MAKEPDQQATPSTSGAAPGQSPAKAPAAQTDHEADKARTQADAGEADGIDLLKQDHRKLEGLFQQFEKESDGDAKRRLVGQIAHEFLTHSRIEEELFYPACRGRIDDKLLDEAQVEHDGAKMLLLELRGGAGRDRFFDARVKVLSEYVKHHVGEEEKPGEGIMDLARAAGIDATALGRTITRHREEIRRDVEAERNPPMPSLQLTKGTAEKEYDMAQQDYRERSRSSRYDDDDDYRGNRRMPPRDEEGRFMSDDRGRGGRYDDDDRRSARLDDYTRRGSRYDDDDRGRGRGGWFGDPEGHAEASRRGWDNPDHGPSGWYGDPRGHAEASRRGWDNPDHGRSGWYGDPEGHSEASRRGWEHRDNGRSSSRYEDDDRRRSYASRERDYDDRGYSARGRDEDDRGRGRGGWFGDSRGHSEAARRGRDDR